MCLRYVGDRNEVNAKGVCRLIFGFIGYISSTFITTTLASIFIKNISWAITFFCVVIWLCFISANKLKDVLFSVAIAFCYEYIASRFWSFSTEFLPNVLDRMVRQWASCLIKISFDTITYLIGYFVLKKFVPKNQSTHLKHELWIIILVIVLVVSSLESIMSASDALDLVLAHLLQIAFAATLLSILFIFTKKRQKEAEETKVLNAIRSQKEQYLQTKQYLEIISIKVHDFKQDINYALETGSISKESAERLLNIVERFGILDIDSGLKTLLSDKILLCDRRNIRFTYTIEEKSFDFIEAADTISLVNNILYNAIEHVSIYEDESKRFIMFKAYTKNDFLFIQCENYCKTAPQFIDGLPVTTKDDDTKHGLGLKGLRYIVNKYNGTMQITTPEKMFQVRILIPLK